MADKKEKKFYTIDNDKRVVIIDKTVKATADDLNMLKVYGAMGFAIREKSLKRAAEMTKRAAKMPSDADIKAALKDKPEALAEYEAIKHSKSKNVDKGGFFAARKWYLDNHADKKGKK